MLTQLNSGSKSTESMGDGGRQRDTDSAERAQRRKFPPSRENQGALPRWIPCYISSVKRLILPVCRIRLLICSEGFSRQSLNVLKPNKVTSNISSGIIFLTVGQRKANKKKEEALRNLPVTYLTFQKCESYTLQTPYSIKHT